MTVCLLVALRIIMEKWNVTVIARIRAFVLGNESFHSSGDN